MRWEGQQIKVDGAARLPGYRDGATVRHFDAPEALDMRFYEVRARSVLNRVPERSAAPFRWTVNPYRGCSHACIYCAAGDTPVLMGDGRTRPLEDVRPGDEIYGTERDRRHRRYVRTVVLDRWRCVRPACAVTLDDGTRLVVGEDHRLLSRRGWKYAIGADHGAGRRPHLTPGTEVLGPGRFVGQPDQTPNYRRGYICGIARGDGHPGTDGHPANKGATAHRFRPALANLEALTRARTYLRLEGVEAEEFAFAAASGTRGANRAERAWATEGVLAAASLARWPRDPDGDWCKGFLAGLFDAGGSAGGGIRFVGDPVILDRAAWCLRRLGHRSLLERRAARKSVGVLRLLGGLPERLRLQLGVDPAITRKRRFDGLALENPAPRRVVDVERLGMSLALHDVTTGTGDWVGDGVVHHNCFARPTHTYLGFDAGRDFEREIVVKVNAPEVLRAELCRPRWNREHVAMGTNTDPYQWVEARYRLMPGIWEALRDTATPASILTKSPLLLRDTGLMRALAERAAIRADLSVPSLDERAWRSTEPHTPHPRARLEAVAELNRRGIPCGVLIAPLMPGINDAPAQVEAILEAAAEAGAVDIGGLGLHLRGEVRQLFMAWLETHRPELVGRYRELYRRGAYLPPGERNRLSRLAHGARRAAAELPPRRRDPGARAPSPPDPAPARPEQPALF